MRKPIIFIVMLAVVCIGVFAYGRSGAAEIGNLDIYQGSADVVSGSSTVEGRTGLPIKHSDVIRVGAGSRVAVILRDGSVFRLEAGTEVRVSELSYANDDLKNATVEMNEGKMWWNTQPLATGGRVEVETPTLVATVRGTSFHTAYDETLSEIYVSTHAVDASLQTDPSQVVTLMAGQLLRVRHERSEEDFSTPPTVLDDADKSEWIRFNEKEDEKLALSRGAAPSSASSSVTSSIASSPARSSTRSSQSTINAPVSSSVKSSSQSSSVPRSSVASIQSSVGAASSPVSATPTRLVLTADQTELDPGERVRLYVTAFYADGSRGEYRDVDWFVDPSSVGSIDQGGMFEANEAGNASVTAKHGSVTSNILTITVRGQQVQAPVLQRISVTYVKHVSSTGTSGLPTATFTATAHYSDGSTSTITQQAQWSVTGSAEGSISQSGEYQPYQQGNDTVTAVFEDISGSATIAIP